MKSSLRPRSRPLSKKEKEKLEIQKEMKRLRQKTAMAHGLDEYGRGKAMAQGRLKTKSKAKMSGGASFFDLLPKE